MSKRIIILGAGLSGLSTAYHLQNGCCVYEQEDEVGGLARSDKVDGFTFDYDGHLLHFKTDYVKKLIQKLLPGLFVAHSRNSWVFSHNVFTKYPFQANTYGLPSSVVKKCILGMFDAVSERSRLMELILRNGCSIVSARELRSISCTLITISSGLFPLRI